MPEARKTSSGGEENTIKGKWLFDDSKIASVKSAGLIAERVNFTSHLPWKEMRIDGAVDSINGIYYRDPKTDTDPYMTVYTKDGGWTYEGYKDVDFGENEQTVSDAFHELFTQLATKVGGEDPEEPTPPPTPTTITYNGNTIASLSAGQSATLPCNGKVMASDVLITGACSVKYNGVVIASLAEGQTVTLACKDRVMASDVLVTLSASNALPAPTITLDGDILTIKDESGLAEAFDILVDGEVVETVSAKGSIESIEFTITDIDGTTKVYFAEEGMTWGEWVASEYNTDRFHTDEYGLVYFFVGCDDLGNPYHGLEIMDAEVTEAIVANRNYRSNSSN